MTVETAALGEPIVKSGPYTGDGTTAAFDYEFKIQSDEELQVIRQNADLTETVLTLDTQYTVGSVGDNTGGAITLLDPATDLPTGTKLVILFNGDFNQSTDYANQSQINLATLEDVLDDIVMHTRQLKELVGRSLQTDTFGTVDLDTLRANINTLAAISSDITSVAGLSADVSSVAAIDTEVATVAGISVAVTTLSGISADISTVAGIAADVTAVAALDPAAIAQDAADADAAATAASGSASAAAASYDSFDDRYLGPKASAPATDNDGDALVTGALYWNTASNNLFVWDGAAWAVGSFTAGGFLAAANNLSELTNATTARSNLGLVIGTHVQAYSSDNALLTSPAFTGNPTAPTQTAGNNSTRVATTAFVKTAVDAGGSSAILTTAGTASAFTLALPTSLTNAAGQTFRVRFHLAPDAAATLAIDGQTALALRLYDGAGALAALATDDVSIDSIVEVTLVDEGGTLRAVINRDRTAYDYVDAQINTANILAALTGLTAGAVGTFAFARQNSGAAANFGDTVSGSLIQPTDASASGGQSVLSGTWRCLGQTSTPNGTPNDTTLFIRIS